ncbi:histone deacetylase [Robiginitalea sp. M366]|uniref:histone deacetylase family protein n=1 Tax=Robiginitalea aestuariiviva TaxID=3036903 RepID=UPI00240DD1DF|nr:histone deacetylase [Robiginitalea aestuariiviva]MDG1571221.1 histone deacetylase [Robiginitalea aestuariiviva]
MLKIAYHPIYKHPLPEGHRFPMQKYDLLPQQLLHEGTCTPEHFFAPELPDDADILRAHTPQYYGELCAGRIPPKAMRKVGFPWSEALVTRERRITQGTIQGCHYALQHGIAMNIAGGTHHAYSDRGEAFCMLNDQAIGAHYLLANGLAQRILILDLDVHQGNGTAEIFRDVPQVFTFSMHGKANYPFKKEVSDWDIALERGTDDAAYLNILHESLESLWERVQPDFVFYLCGVDILGTDKLGTLGLTPEGCRQRDLGVLQWCRHHGLPVQCSMGGGYSPQLRIIVEAHAQTFRLAQHLYF